MNSPRSTSKLAKLNLLTLVTASYMALMFSNVKPIILALTCKFELEVLLNQKKKEVTEGYFPYR
jgi:hypothetical protein